MYIHMSVQNNLMNNAEWVHDIHGETFMSDPYRTFADLRRFMFQLNQTIFSHQLSISIPFKPLLCLTFNTPAAWVWQRTPPRFLKYLRCNVD